MLKFSIFYFFSPQVTKKIWKKILNIQENSIWLKWFFKLFIYLFDKHFLKLVTKVCSFFWVVGAGGEVFFFFFELLMCSYHFSKLFPKFSMCPPRMFPITPDFKPICFAQNPPLFTYISGVFVVMGISPCEKLWWTLLRREIHPANEKCNHVLTVLWFFSF